MRCGPYPLRLHMRVIPMSVEGSVRSLALLLVLYASAAHAASATANVFTCPISPGTQITVPVGIRVGSIPLASYVVDVGYDPPVLAPVAGTLDFPNVTWDATVPGTITLSSSSTTAPTGTAVLAV